MNERDSPPTQPNSQMWKLCVACKIMGTGTRQVQFRGWKWHCWLYGPKKRKPYVKGWPLHLPPLHKVKQTSMESVGTKIPTQTHFIWPVHQDLTSSSLSLNCRSPSTEAVAMWETRALISVEVTPVCTGLWWYRAELGSGAVHDNNNNDNDNRRRRGDSDKPSAFPFQHTLRDGPRFYLRTHRENAQSHWQQRCTREYASLVFILSFSQVRPIHTTSRKRTESREAGVLPGWTDLDGNKWRLCCIGAMHSFPHSFPFPHFHPSIFLVCLSVPQTLVMWPDRQSDRLWSASWASQETIHKNNQAHSLQAKKDIKTPCAVGGRLCSWTQSIPVIPFGLSH